MMIGRVLRQDWLLLRSSPGLWLALALLVGVTVLAALAGHARLGFHDAAVQSRTEAAEQSSATSESSTAPPVAERTALRLR